MFSWVQAAVLFKDDGCNGVDNVTGGGGDGDAWGQCEYGCGVDKRDCDGGAVEVCDKGR